jgi:hypothetical protein
MAGDWRHQALDPLRVAPYHRPLRLPTAIEPEHGALRQCSGMSPEKNLVVPGAARVIFMELWLGRLR